MIGSVKNWIFIVAILGSISFIGYREYQLRNFKTEVETLRANSAILSNALKDSNDAFNILKEEHDRVRALYEKTVDEFQKIDRSNQYAKDRIDSVQIDDSATEEINKLYFDTMRCIEISTGSELTQKEKDAKNAEEFNSVCPNYFVPGSMQQ